MQVNSTNAVVVSAIFLSLADARFTMRTPDAIRKTSGAEVTDAQLVDVAAQLGIRLRRRVRDDAILIERPASMTVEASAALAERAKSVVVDNAEPFDVDFAPPAPVADATVGESSGDDVLGEDDEDAQFSVH